MATANWNSSPPKKDGKIICYGSEPLAEKCPCVRRIPLARQTIRQVRWTFSLKAPVSDFITADLDGDGKAEALCGAGDGRLYALKSARATAAILWSVDLGRAVGSPILADLDGNGKAQIIVPTETASCTAWGGRTDCDLNHFPLSPFRFLLFD